MRPAFLMQMPFSGAGSGAGCPRRGRYCRARRPSLECDRRGLAARRIGVAAVRWVTSDVDVSYAWHEALVPPVLEITQVYGYLLCPDTARVLVQDDGGVFNLPGGTPEPCDSGLVATLVREAFEGNQVRVDDAIYLGYQEVRRPGRPAYAQVRMTALIRAFEARRPDPRMLAAVRRAGGRVPFMTSCAP
jgi:hypothetical protein